MNPHGPQCTLKAEWRYRATAKSPQEPPQETARHRLSAVRQMWAAVQRLGDPSGRAVVADWARMTMAQKKCAKGSTRSLHLCLWKGQSCSITRG